VSGTLLAKLNNGKVVIRVSFPGADVVKTVAAQGLFNSSNVLVMYVCVSFGRSKDAHQRAVGKEQDAAPARYRCVIVRLESVWLIGVHHGRRFPN